MNIRQTIALLLLATVLLPAGVAAETADSSALAELQSKGFFLDAQGKPLSGTRP